MRCSCKECGTYMIQADSDRLGCVCPDCGYRCRDCLGTDTVVSREHLLDLARDPRFFPEKTRQMRTKSDLPSSSFNTIRDTVCRQQRKAATHPRFSAYTRS